MAQLIVPKSRDPAPGWAMPRGIMEDASSSSSVLDPVAIDSPLQTQLGFLVVVIAPALFWATLVFAGGQFAGSPSAAEFAIAVFVTSSAFLTFVARALKVRI